MRLLVFINDLSGVSYHRLLVPYSKVNYLDSSIEVRFVGNKIEKNVLIELAKNSDFFIFSRTFNIDILKELKGKVTLIDDIDDWWELDYTHGLYYNFKYCGIAQNMEDCARIADYITTTTPILAERLKRFNPNVLCFNNALEQFGQYIPNKTTSNRLRFGIIGSSSHTTDMVLLKGITKYIPDAIKDKIQFVLCGFDGGETTYFDANGNKEKTEDTPWEEVCWSEWERNLTNNYSLVSDDYKNNLLKFDKVDYYSDGYYRRIWTKDVEHYAYLFDEIDVLVAPLKDTNFNKCKSELKMVEASVKHKGLIISKVDPYKHLINNNCIGVPNGRGALGFAEAIVFYVNNPEVLEFHKLELAKLTEPGGELNLTRIGLERIEWLTNIYKNIKK